MKNFEILKKLFRLLDHVRCLFGFSYHLEIILLFDYNRWVNQIVYRNYHRLPQKSGNVGPLRRFIQNYKLTMFLLFSVTKFDNFRPSFRNSTALLLTIV